MDSVVTCAERKIPSGKGDQPEGAVMTPDHITALAALISATAALVWAMRRKP